MDDHIRPSNEGFDEVLEMRDDGVLCAWGQMGAYSIHGGREIIIDPAPDADERLVRLPLLGTVFAILLHQRGRLVLHASAVEINGAAAAFVGHKGWGKSTLAATLHREGHRLLTDDVLALELVPGGRPIIYPGFPVFKLWPDAVESLGDDPTTLPRVVEQFEKRMRLARTGFSLEPVPLGEIYVLGEATDPTVEPLSSTEATLQLIMHSFVSRLGTRALKGSSGGLHLKQCAQVARTLPCHRLLRPRSAAILPSTASLVVEHMRLRTSLVA